MFILLSNGQIIEKERTSLIGAGVIGVFLTKEDDIDKILPFYKEKIHIRMVDMDRTLLKTCLSNFLNFYKFSKVLKKIIYFIKRY